MKFSKLYGTLFVAMSFMLLAASCSEPTSAEDDFIPGELLVSLHEDAEFATLDELFPYPEIEVLEYFEYMRIVWISVPEYTEAEWIDLLEQDERIKHANYVRGNVTPRD